jgi:hypothetical protein
MTRLRIGFLFIFTAIVLVVIGRDLATMHTNIDNLYKAVYLLHQQVEELKHPR